jgi:hypothetical protein
MATNKSVLASMHNADHAPRIRKVSLLRHDPQHGGPDQAFRRELLDNIRHTQSTQKMIMDLIS